MNTITHGPALVLRWLAVLVGVVAWLLIVPIVELGRSVARTARNVLPGRSRRPAVAPADPPPAARDALDARSEVPRRARSG